MPVARSVLRSFHHTYELAQTLPLDFPITVAKHFKVSACDSGQIPTMFPSGSRAAGACMNLSSMRSMPQSPFSIVSSGPLSSFGSSSWRHSGVSSDGPQCPMAELLGILLRTRLHWPYLPLNVQGSAGTSLSGSTNIR